jgi:hypothetical protein
MISMFLTSIVMGFAAGFAGGLISRFKSASGVIAVGPARSVRATSISLVDEQERERAVLKLVEGRPILLLTDERRLPSGDVISMPRVAMGILQNGTPSLELADLSGRKRVTLAVMANDAALLELAAKNGKSRISIDVGPDGPPAITAVNDVGRPTAKWPQ